MAKTRDQIQKAIANIGNLLTDISFDNPQDKKINGLSINFKLLNLALTNYQDYKDGRLRRADTDKSVTVMLPVANIEIDNLCDIWEAYVEPTPQDAAAAVAPDPAPQALGIGGLIGFGNGGVAHHPAHAAAVPPGHAGAIGVDDEDQYMQQIAREHEALEAVRRANAEAREQAQLEAAIAQAQAASLLDFNPRAWWELAPAAPRDPVIDHWGGAAGEAELRALPLPRAAADEVALAGAVAASEAEIQPGVKDVEKQRALNNSVAKVSLIDKARDNGTAADQILLLKKWFVQILKSVKSYEKELQRHNVDVPEKLLKSPFIKDCTHLNGDDPDAFVDALLGLDEGSFDALIH